MTGFYSIITETIIIIGELLLYERPASPLYVYIGFLIILQAKATRQCGTITIIIIISLTYLPRECQEQSKKQLYTDHLLPSRNNRTVQEWRLSSVCSTLSIKNNVFLLYLSKWMHVLLLEAYTLFVSVYLHRTILSHVRVSN